MAPDKKDIINRVTITEYLGCPLGQLIISPLRHENTPSFRVFIGSNGNQMWHDFGSGQSGDVVKLHMLMESCNFRTALGELTDWSGQASPIATAYPHMAKPSAESTPTKYGIRSGKLIHQSRYIQHTHLPVPDWIAESIGLYTDTYGNLCMPNFAGGIHLKGGLCRD